jgi:cytosine/adenosine deaminase-related metal-dependent hydrolase
MVYRKLRANAIFNGKEFLDQHYVLVTTEDGTVVDNLPAFDAGEGIETFSGILTPGFVNCHCHLELSHLKGLIPEKKGLIDFVIRVITQRDFPEEEILDAIASAEAQMFKNGIVVVGDICNNSLTIPQKRKKRLIYHNFIEVSGWNPAIAGARLAKSKSIFNEFRKLPAGHKRSSISPHAPYSVSDSLWKMMVSFFDDQIITMHNQETAWEDELFEKGTGEALRLFSMLKLENGEFRASGRSSFQTILPRLAKAKKIILVHNTYTRPEDITHLEDNPLNPTLLYWCLCPNANLYIEDKLPPVSALRNAKANIALGTDSLASNHSLSILDEIKTLRHFHPEVPINELLQWATHNGAQALGLQDQYGSFAQGKKPGINLLENTDGKKINAGTTVRKIL